MTSLNNEGGGSTGSLTRHVGVEKIGLVVGILVVLGIGLLSAQYGLGTESQDAIKVGGVFALSGDWAVGGKTEANFVRMAVEEINRNGGVNGKELEVVFEDDKCSGKESVKAVKKLISQDGVDFILGPSCTPASGPVAPMVERKEVFTLAATTTANNIFDNYSYAFRTSPPAQEAAEVIGKLGREKHSLDKVGMVVEQTEFGESWAESFEKGFERAGGKVVLTQRFSSSTSDFSSMVTKLKEKGVDGVFVSTQKIGDAARIVKELKRQGMLDEVTLMGNPNAIDPKVDEKTDGILPEDAFSVVPRAENQELLEKYREKYGEDPGFKLFYTGAMYDAVYMLKDALEKCGEDPTCVRDHFRDDIEDYDGEVATWSFDENGDPVISGAYKEINIVDGEKNYRNLPSGLSAN